jgi:hypothetical protein
VRGFSMTVRSALYPVCPAGAAATLLVEAGQEFVPFELLVPPTLPISLAPVVVRLGLAGLAGGSLIAAAAQGRGTSGWR